MHGVGITVEDAIKPSFPCDRDDVDSANEVCNGLRHVKLEKFEANEGLTSLNGEGLETIKQGAEVNAKMVEEELKEEEVDSGQIEPKEEADFRGLTYIEQMDRIISSVIHEESFLFTTTELVAFEVFRQLDEDSQLLFIQLLNRDHKLIRVNKQKFRRVKDRHAACSTLCRPDVAFAEDAAPTTLDGLFACKDLLTIQDIQGYANWCGLQKLSSLKRNNIIRELKKHVRAYGTSQPTLHTYFRPKSARSDLILRKTREEGLVEWIIKDIGPVIRMADDKRRIFNRLLLVYNRTTEHRLDASARRENPMANSILSNMRVSPRRFYPYIVHRSPLVWPTRIALLEYEELLETEVNILQMMSSSSTAGFTKQEDAEQRERALAIVDECRVRWEHLITLPAEEREHITGVRWMNVFSPGWVLTRIMEKGVSLLGATPLAAKDLPEDRIEVAMEERKKIFEKEVELLRMLLGQQSFRPSARGWWWDRLAMIYHHHFGVMYKRRRGKDDTEALETAWSVCMSALEDKWVESGHRKAIETRLLRLRSRLGKAVGTLHFPSWKTGTCVRIYANKVAKPDVPNFGMKCEYLLEDGRTIGVEELALEYYAAHGWKGFHSETSILSTLYGLLFWDIIYMDDIPGVFASEFQTSPLDLQTEFFYESRREAIETRLAEIERSERKKGGMSTIEALMRRVDEGERGKNTLCIGVTWKYGSQDLIDVAEAIGGQALSKICGLFSRTFWAYASGVPDLCLWKSDTKDLKIVEVKSDKDRFSQQQMVWMHLLTTYGLQVEEFYVEDSNLPAKRRRRK